MIWEDQTFQQGTQRICPLDLEVNNNEHLKDMYNKNSNYCLYTYDNILT